MKSRGFPAVTVSKRAEQTIKSGHPWVFETEISAGGRDAENGDIVDILSCKGAYLATGFYNENSKIRLRILCRNANEIPDEAFFGRVLTRAVDYRETVMCGDLSCCRLIFGESDGLPGWTVDKFGDVLVMQTLSLGIERIKERLTRQLLDILKQRGYEISGVFERNDVAIREREGMKQGKGWLRGFEGKSTDIIITENGIKYHVDIENGQKTGFFLDQKFNRAACAKIAKGKRVLDCFTHTGSFALNCAKGGAASVTAVDISADALVTAKRNAEINGLDIDLVCMNVFDMLASMKDEKKYDFIILDPPAFTKSRATVESALRGYKEINLRAMKLLPRGGYLATCSCSHFVNEEKFREMLVNAAADAGVTLRQIESRQQACDHPIMWNVPETDYLKFIILQKM